VYGEGIAGCRSGRLESVVLGGRRGCLVGFCGWFWVGFWGCLRFLGSGWCGGSGLEGGSGGFGEGSEMVAVVAASREDVLGSVGGCAQVGVCWACWEVGSEGFGLPSEVRFWPFGVFLAGDMLEVVALR
jgi:hypothetical protein